MLTAAWSPHVLGLRNGPRMWSLLRAEPTCPSAEEQHKDIAPRTTGLDPENQTLGGSTRTQVQAASCVISSLPGSKPGEARDRTENWGGGAGRHRQWGGRGGHQWAWASCWRGGCRGMPAQQWKCTKCHETVHFIVADSPFPTCARDMNVILHVRYISI